MAMKIKIHMTRSLRRQEIWPHLALAGGDSLPLLIERAVVTHPSAKAQEALIAAGQAGVESARCQFYPTPSVSSENVSTSASDLV